MNTLLAFLKPFLKDKGIMLATDKGVWVAAVGVAFSIANKALKLGLDDSTLNIVALAVGGWIVVHFAHENTVNKE